MIPRRELILNVYASRIGRWVLDDRSIAMNSFKGKKMCLDNSGLSMQPDIQLQERTTNRLNMLRSGPWNAGTMRLMLSCLERNFDIHNENERRKPQPLEEFFFEETEFQGSCRNIEFQILIGHDRPTGFVGRRLRSYWLFGNFVGEQKYYPVARSDEIKQITSLMMAIITGADMFNHQ